MEPTSPPDETSPTAILEAQIRECFGRVAYSHKTHEKCADILLTRLSWLKHTQIVLSVLVSGSLLTEVLGKHSSNGIVPAVLSTALVFINLYFKNYNYGQMAQAHKETADRLWNVRESYLSLLTDLAAEIITPAQGSDKRDKLQKELATIATLKDSRLLEVSREAEHLGALCRFRTDRTLNAIVAQLRGIIEQRSAFAEKQRIVHLSNGVIVFGKDGVRLEPFSPSFRSRNRSPIAYDPAAKCPRFLNELVLPAVHPDDALLLQKMAGQCLLGENITQRMTILDGLAGRGKTQYANVVQKVVGIENVMQLRTQHLSERFEIFRFLRKTLLVGVDVDENFMATPGASVAKGLVGGDWFNAEMKNGNGCFPVQGRFNLIITSNCRLRVRLQGDIGAWRRRMLIVRYEAPAPTKKIPDFADVLIREEGSGILNWALEGLALLLADVDEIGDVRLTERQQAVVDSLLAESDSLRVFLSERVEHTEGEALTTTELVEGYAEFCPERGWDPLPITAIHRQLESLMLELFQVCRSNSVQRDGKSQKGFRGVAFKPSP